MTDTRLHFYFNEDNYSYEGSHSICVDNGEENIIYLIYDREESVFADIINNESNETTNYFEAVDIYSLDNDEFGDFYNILSLENSLETVMEYIEEYPSLTLLGTLDYSGIVTGEMIEEFYIGELESSHSALITNNKTVSSLYIHNKEVQSIITTDNVVLYEKESTPIPSEPNSISLSASKHILSEHDTDTCVLSVTVTDENNNACSNQTVTFKSNNTVLGTTITDNTGVATYTYNSQGVGEFYASASIDNLSSNSLLIEDCKYYKETISSTITPQVPLSSNCVIEFDVFKKVNQNTNAFASINIGGDTDYIGCGFIQGGNSQMYLFERTSSVSYVQTAVTPFLTLNKNYHVKLIINGTTVVMVIGDIQYVLKDVGIVMDKLNKIDYSNNALISNVKVNDVVCDDVVLSASKSVLSYYDNNSAFDDWTGTYVTGTDEYYYLTPNSNNLTFNGDLPSEFEMRYKFKTNNVLNGHGGLWCIGTDANNCLLVGHDETNRRMSIYVRSNGTNTIQSTFDFAYNTLKWTETIITYKDGMISVSMNNNTLSCALSDASFLKIYANYNQVKLADIIIKDLSTGEIVSDSSNNIVLSASVVDSHDNPVPNSVVIFDINGLSEKIFATDSDGVCKYEYVAQGIGDVYVSAETNSLSSNSILIEDCMYFKEEEVSYVSTYTSGDHSIRLDNNLSLVLTDDFEFSMECKSNINGSRLQLSSISGASSSTTNYGFGFNCDGTAMNSYYRTTTSYGWGSNIPYDTNYHLLKFVRNGDTFTAYLDDINEGNQTFTWWNSKSPFSLYWWVWRSGTITAKNIKIKKIIHNISPVNILDNVSFTHSDGTTSRDVSYMNNESTTMNVQGFEDANTIAINGEIDFLLGTGEDYRDITLTPDVEYDFTGHDFDIIRLNHTGTYNGSALSIGDKTILYDAADNYGISGLQRDTATNFKIRDGKIYCCDNNTKYVTPSDLKVIAFASNIIIRIYNCINNYSLIGTQTTNNQGYASYEYEATGQGEFYIKAQSHNDSTVTTSDYLISDWIYKDFTNYGGWSAFSGRNTSSMSISDNTLRVTSGNKGGAHSVNTIFNLPNDDYEVSFKITEATKTDSNGVRIGIHSANYSDHHEKACCGIAYVGGTGNKVSFDYSNNNVTAVTKEVIADNLTVGDIIRFRVEGTTLKCYHNDSLYVTETLAWLHDPMWLYAQSWGTGTANMSITDFRVKRIINN